MQNLVKQVDNFSNRLNEFIYKITGTLVLLLFGLVLYGIFFRYFLGNPLSWVLPISRLILVWIGLLSISIAFKEGQHIALGGFVSMLPMVIKKIILGLGYILILIYLFILVWEGFPIALQSTQLIMISAKFQIPTTWSMMAVPVSALINLIHLLPIPLLIQRNIKDKEIEKRIQRNIKDKEIEKNKISKE